MTGARDEVVAGVLDPLPLAHPADGPLLREALAA